MLQAEFEKRIGWEVTAENYRTIEHVYNYVNGMDKELAAMMYRQCGMKIFEALTEYADTIEQAEAKVNKAEAELEKAKKELAGLTEIKMAWE